MNVQRRDDRFLDELSKLYTRRKLTLIQLELWEYAYPELASFVSDVRACLRGADGDGS
jgi:hypothetical protein